MDNCIFCKIIKKEIPADIVYENNHTIAFLDAQPRNLGHTLVVPKEHHANLFEMPDDMAKEVMLTIKRISLAVKDATGATGINVLQNNGASAGQVVFHYHTHVVPRFEGDGINPLAGRNAAPTKEESSKIAEIIRNSF